MPKTIAVPKTKAPYLIVAEPILTILVAPDGDEFTAYCPELDIATAMPTPEAAVKDLLELMREYAEDYMANLKAFSQSPNRAHHLPYIRKISACRNEWGLRQLVAIKHGNIHL